MSVAGAFERVDHQVHINRLHRDVGAGRQVRVDRNHVVPPVQLQSVAGVEQHADTTLALERLTRALDRSEHLLPACIAYLDHDKAQSAQGIPHGPRIVGRIGQRSARVGSVADDQGHSKILGRLRLRGHDHCGQGDRGQRKRTKDFVRNRHSKPLD